jgi:hypothetical protein
LRASATGPTVAGDAFGDSWKREPYGLLGQEHRDRLARGSGRAGDEKRDRHPFRVLEPGREVADDFAVAVFVAVHRALLS